MKKEWLLYSILLVLGVAVNSCIYEKIVEITPPPPSPNQPALRTYYPKLLTGDMEPHVSTYATPQVIDGTQSIMLWSKGEHVGAFMKGSNNQLLFANRDYDLKLDTLDRSVLLTDTITTALQRAVCYGYYPYQESLSSENMMSYRLREIQDQSTEFSTMQKMDQSIRDNVLMLAAQSDSFDLNSGQPLLEFKSVFSYFRFQVIKSPTFSNFNSQRIRKVTLYVADKNDIETPLNYPLAGDYTIDVSKAPGAAGYQGPAFTSPKNVISATVSGANTIRETLLDSPYFWLVINPVPIKDNECFVSIVETDGRWKIISKHDVSTLNSNTVYSLRSEAKPENTVSDVQPVTHFVDDDGTEWPSNSYVVSKAGVCQIPMRKVNADADLQGDTVVWLWASKESGRKDFDVRELIDPATIFIDGPEGGKYIRFRAGTSLGRFSKGNVVLALRDRLGKIVWTWHIWLTDEPQDTPYEVNTFLDRNIGALSANMTGDGIDNYGFVYQWGRKDPFFGGNGVTNEASNEALSIARNHTIINTTGGWQSGVDSWNVLMGATTTLHAETYPMTFICNNSLLDPRNEPADWLSTPNENLWSSTAKTDNDPCPYVQRADGTIDRYRVPGRDELVALYVNTQDNMWYFKHIDNRSWDYHFYRDNVTTAWPSAGMRQGRASSADGVGGQLLRSGTDYTNGQCFYWTSSPINVNGVKLPGGSHRVYTTTENILYRSTDWGDNSDAYPIRCIKIKN